jgi:hypothetical protein
MSVIHKTSFTESNLAERWAVSIKTLQDWRRKGVGPEYLKLGKAIRYPNDVIEKYEAQHMSRGI